MSDIHGLEELVSAVRILETERCRLRPPSDEDRENVWTAAHHPSDITKGMLWDPPEKKEVIDEWTKNSLKSWEQGDNLQWTITDKETEEFLGRIVIRKQENKDNVWYIGFWAHPDKQGKGYTTEAAKAVVDAAFQILGVQSIISSHATWNKGSGNVLLKVGMKYTGHNPAGFKKHGEDVPEEEYELTRTDWQKTKMQ